MIRHAHLVVDLSNGDAGKGTIVDALVRKYCAHTVIRFNGGAQAAHRVVTYDGREHIFSQFGSGTFVPGTRTVLSKFMLVQPWALDPEAQHLEELGITDAFDRLFIHEDALIITPFHRAANRLRERARAKWDGRHGSCGIGVGETAHDALTLKESLVVRVRDLRDLGALKEKLQRVQKQKAFHVDEMMFQLIDDPEAVVDIRELEDPEAATSWIKQLEVILPQLNIVDDTWFASLLNEPGHVVFEGAQGVLIDESRGFHPYTTWSNCTFQNALDLLANYDGEIHRIGVVRAYATRHGPGPFVTEDVHLTERLPDACNKMDPWQRGFRVGHFDCVSIRYAINACGGIDSLAITCLDRLHDEPVWNICTHYELVPEDQDSALFDDALIATALVSEINLGPERDLVYQERLTNALMRAKPVLRITATPGSFEESVEHHIHRIAHELAVPISILSFGPTAVDKKFL